MSNMKTTELYEDLLVYRWLYLHGYVTEADIEDDHILFEIMGSKKPAVPLPAIDRIPECVDNALDRYAASKGKEISEKKRNKDYKRILRKADGIHPVIMGILASSLTLLFLQIAETIGW